MPKRRDAVSRASTRLGRDATRENPNQKYSTPVRGNRTMMQTAGAEGRLRGRRGVRARARAERIAAARQPNSTSTTNSPP